MNVLVTGGAGFIGSHVAEALLAGGHAVHVLDNLSHGSRENLPEGIVFHALDVLDPSLPHLFATYRFEALFHLAAQIDVRRSVADPVFDAEVNIIGFLRLLEAGRRHGLRRVVFSSSGGAIYGDAPERPTPETTPERPISPYGVSKLASERYLAGYASQCGIVGISLRYANVDGPRQTPEGDAGVIAVFIERMLAGRSVVVFGDGSQTRDFVFVGDVVRANLLALDHRSSGAYNIGTGQETSVMTLYQTLHEALDRDAGCVLGEARGGEVQRSVLDIQRAGRALGWRPEVSLSDGLRRTIAWFESRASSTPLR
jgi:UDP-glucose 4-epimerase